MITLNTFPRYFFRDAFNSNLYNDDTVIVVREYHSGMTITTGHWYEDNILDVMISHVFVVDYTAITSADGTSKLYVDVSGYKVV